VPLHNALMKLTRGLRQRLKIGPPVTLRAARPGDGVGALDVIHSAVLVGAQAHYSQPERDAWANSPTADGLETAMLSGDTVVAQNRSGQMIGFMTLGPDGYLDFAYVLPDHIGTGLSDCLYDEIEDIATTRRYAVLSCEASLLSRSFLQRKGWHVVARQTVVRDGVGLTNFRMEKPFTASPKS